MTKLLVFLSVFLAMPSAHADDRVIALLNKVKDTAEKSQSLTADFSYVTVRPTPEGNVTTKVVGSIKLMKPNYADISYNPKSRYGKRLVSDGKHLWTLSNGNLSYTKVPADPRGQNVNVWRLVTIGGFFDIHHWIQRGVYVQDLKNLHYVGIETIDEVNFDVLEHKMSGTIQGKACPFHQKIYIGPERLVSRFTLNFTLEGKPGSEVAELTNINLGESIEPAEFVFKPPTGSFELPHQR